MRRGIVVGIDSPVVGDGDGSNPPWSGDRQGIREGMEFGSGTAKPLYVRNKNREGIIPSLCVQESFDPFEKGTFRPQRHSR